MATEFDAPLHQAKPTHNKTPVGSPKPGSFPIPGKLSLIDEDDHDIQPSCSDISDSGTDDHTPHKNDSHDIKLQLIQSILSVLNDNTSAPHSPTSSSMSELISVNYTPAASAYPDEPIPEARIPSILRPYNVASYDPKLPPRPTASIRSTTPGSVSGASSSAYRAASRASYSTRSITSPTVRDILPLEDLYGRFESIRNFRAARLDGELEVVAAWRQFAKVPTDYPDLLSIPQNMWVSLTESLRLVASRLSLNDIMDILEIQATFLSTGQHTLTVKPSLYDRLAARCGKILREATWEQLSRFSSLCSNLLQGARAYSGQRVGRPPSHKQYHIIQHRSEAIMPLIEVAVQQVGVGYDKQTESIRLLYGTRVHTGTEQAERKKLARVTMAIAETLSPLLALRLSLPVSLEEYNNRSFGGDTKTKSLRSQYSQHQKHSHHHHHHHHHRSHHRHQRKRTTLDGQGFAPGRAVGGVGGAFQAMGRFALGILLCYAPTTVNEDSDSDDRGFGGVTHMAHSTPNSVEDQGFKAEELCHRMDGFAVESSSETWYTEFSKAHIDVWTERRRNIMLDLAEMSKGLVQTFIPYAAPCLTGEELPKLIGLLAAAIPTSEPSYVATRLRHGAAYILSESSSRVIRQTHKDGVHRISSDHMLSFHSIKTILQAAAHWDWNPNSKLLLTRPERKDVQRACAALPVLRHALQLQSTAPSHGTSAPHGSNQEASGSSSSFAAGGTHVSRVLERTPPDACFTPGQDLKRMSSNVTVNPTYSPTGATIGFEDFELDELDFGFEGLDDDDDVDDDVEVLELGVEVKVEDNADVDVKKKASRPIEISLALDDTGSYSISSSATASDNEDDCDEGRPSCSSRPPRSRRMQTLERVWNER